MSEVAFLRDQPSDSWKKASDGWYIEIELVMAARNSMKNQIAPINVADADPSARRPRAAC